MTDAPRDDEDGDGDGERREDAWEDESAAGPGDGGSAVAPETVYATMEPLEPYTTGELADVVHASKRAVRRALTALTDGNRIRRKRPEPGRAIWVRPGEQIDECPNCGRAFEVKVLHPVLSYRIRYCPHCGTRL